MFVPEKHIVHKDQTIHTFQMNSGHLHVGAEVFSVGNTMTVLKIELDNSVDLLSLCGLVPAVTNGFIFRYTLRAKQT